MDYFVDQKPRKQSSNQSGDDAQKLDKAIAALNEFDAQYGSFADQYLDEI